MHVCLQAGHQSIASNCWPAMRGGTGAPGEILWTPMIRSKVAALLRSRNIEVTEVDANVNCSGPFGPFDLFLAIHYQSNNPSASGFGVFTPDPSVDTSHARSVELAGKLRSVYGQRTGLADQSAAWDNVNTQLYYVWQVMNGPLALIECGVGAPGAPDNDLLWNQPDLIAAAIAEGICAGLGVPALFSGGLVSLRGDTLDPVNNQYDKDLINGVRFIQFALLYDENAPPLGDGSTPAVFAKLFHAQLRKEIASVTGGAWTAAQQAELDDIRAAAHQLIATGITATLSPAQVAQLARIVADAHAAAATVPDVAAIKAKIEGIFK